MTGEQILSKLLIENPYYGYLAGKIRFKTHDSVMRMRITFEEVPTIIYNEEWFTSLKNQEQVGVVVHQLLHIALLHFYRRDGREVMLWNVAADIAVTEFMPEYPIIDDIVTRQAASREIGVFMEPARDAEYYYDVLMSAEDMISFTNEKGEATVIFEGGKSYYSEILEEMPPSDLGSESIVQTLSEVQSSASDESAIHEGLLPYLDEAYKAYQINWRSVLKQFLSGHGRIRTRKSYKRQSRRFEDLPGTKRSVGLQALLAIDESGSISDHEVDVFRKELVRINQIVTDDILVVRFDTECTEPVSLKQFVSDHKREKGGGTDFRPVFELADELKIRNVILFTDGDGAAPDQVQQRVLWVLTNKGKAPADYGISVKFTEDN